MAGLVARQPREIDSTIARCATYVPSTVKALSVNIAEEAVESNAHSYNAPFASEMSKSNTYVTDNIAYVCLFAAELPHGLLTIVQYHRTIQYRRTTFRVFRRELYGTPL